VKAPKSYFVNHGLAELGLSGVVYDFPPEEMERICQRLDADLAELETKGARVRGWVYADTPNGADGATVVNVPIGLAKLIFMSAAIAAAPSIGKNLSSVTVAQLKLSRDNLLFFGKRIPQYQRNTNMPVGSGNQVWADGVQFYVDRPPRLDAGPDAHIDPDMELWNGDNDINRF
jgi:hypothetical protein